jgi:hypothetical protein
LKILDKNREQIFENSKDINEQAIGFYSYATEVIKGRKKKGEPFDGKDTGELFNQMYMQEVSEFSLVLNLPIMPISLNRKVGYQKTFLDLQIKPKPVN